MAGSRVIGWETWEDLAIILPNVLQCGSCGKLVNYGGIQPRTCPSCQGETGAPSAPEGQAVAPGVSALP